MLVDAHDVAAGSTLTADVCVVGAGAAGITLARALAASQHTVLLLESGGFELDDQTQALYKGTTVGLPIDPTVHFGLDGPRLRYFGGTTNHWSGFCRPFPELDFERRTYVPRSGWPIARADLEPYYAGAADVCSLGPADFTLGYWRGQGLVDEPFLESPTTPHSMVQLTGRPVFGEVYRDEIVGSPNIQLVLWANATRLALSEDGGAIQSIDVKTLTGNSFSATAQAYVLATGGLEVPRLLLASNDRRPAGIGNEHDLVGRHFMEHVNIVAGPVALTIDDTTITPYMPTPHTVEVNDTTRDIALQAVLLLAPDILQREELRACELTLEYPFAPNDHRVEEIFPGTRRGIELLRARGVTTKTVATARVLCEQEPNPASRVTLVRKRDALGMPRIELDWRLTRDDRLSMLRTLRRVGQEIGRRGFGRLRVDVAGYTNAQPGPDDDMDYEVNTGSHHIGTARMSASPTRGVVDADGKVHSVANLYVAGSAVFPTSGANPPTLTIVALALRLADHLATLVSGTAAPVQEPEAGTTEEQAPPGEDVPPTEPPPADTSGVAPSEPIDGA
jgi:choline dehydrogenase-like flavoprotein